MTKQIINRRYNQVVHCGNQFILILTFLLMAFTLPSFGQLNSSSENKSDQSLKASSRVNPTTLAMEFSLPLGVFAQRGGGSFPLAINYSSKLWETKIVSSAYSDSAGTPGPHIIADYKTARFMYSHKSNAGWNTSLQAPRIIQANSFLFVEHPSSGLSIANGTNGFGEEIEIPEDIVNIINEEFANNTLNPIQCRPYNGRAGSMCTVCFYATSDPNVFRGEIQCSPSGGGGGGGGHQTGGGGGSNSTVASFVKRVRIQMSDGSIVEFRKDDIRSQCGFVTAGNSNCTANAAGSYLSVDGSKMRLEYHELQPNGQRRHVLYLPDGSRYLFPFANTQNSTLSAANFVEAEEFFDVNGNKMTFDRSTRVWNDSMGRSFTNPFVPESPDFSNPAIESLQNVTLPGIGGNRTAQLAWKRLKTPGCETDTSSSCGESVLEDPTQELRFIGSETWGANSVDNANQPSLFQGRQWSENIGGVIYNFKENVAWNRIANEAATRFNPVVLKEVVLPDGSKYEFRYNIYGEISKIRYPTGALERFSYNSIPPMGYDMADTFDKANRGVVERKVYLNEQSVANNSPSQHWRYAAELASATGQPNRYKIKITAPDESESERFIHISSGFGYGFSNSIDGTAYEEKSFAAPDATGVKRLVNRTLTEWHQDGPLPNGYSQATRDPRPKRKVSLTFENGEALATMSEMEYETPGENGSTAPDDRRYFARLNLKQTKSYHYLPLTASQAENLDINGIKNLFYQSGQAASITQTDYSYSEQYLNRGIPSRPFETRVIDPANPANVLAKSQVVYDQTDYFDNNYTTTNWENPNSTLRGNVTTARTWVKETDTWLETHTTYDNFGNVRKVWDASGDTTKFVETQYDPLYKYAYPTSVTTPAPDPTGVHGSNTPFTTVAVYDFNTGLPTSTTDINGQTTTMEYNDALLRPTKVTAPNGQQTITEYGDSPGNIFVKVSSQIDETNWKVGYKYFDALLRPTKTRSVDNAGDVYALTCYDNMGRVSKASNPFRNFTNQTCATSSLEWTSNTFDPLGRPISITTPDGAHVDTAYSLATTGNQIGTIVTVTDQALKQRRSITNALGQLTRVDEPDSNNQLGPIDVPTQDTRYEYDGLNNLKTVTQGVQSRTFVYDSLSRLKSATNPESGTVNYGYANNGNLISKTDARSITTTYAYDALNRVKTRTYSDSTPAVSYFYDNIANAKGKLIKVSSSISTTEYMSFDILGRVTRNKQITDGVTYGTDAAPMIYTYNFAGALIEQTYPSGRVVKNTFDTDGDLQQVQSRRAIDTLRNYANAFTYTAAGAASALRLGNGKWETTQFNSRLQPTQIGLGSSATNQGVLKLNYDYGSTDNNGNVKSQIITVPTAGNNTGFTAVQNYTYDYLNRVKSAVENIDANPTPSWRQTFLYDRFGNRTFDTSNNNTTTLASGCPVNVCNPSANLQNNKLIGATYDSSGNTTQSADNQVYVYDAENKMIQASNSAGALGNYFYDGDGKRVKKVVPNGETTVFVYDASGKTVAEYSTVVEPTSTAKVSYLTNDHLGTPRINTDAAGNIVSRSDYLPFGEEITRTSYSSNSIRKKFSGYERDAETSLDFVEARMYSNRLGRFTTVDSAGPDFDNPQTLNKYQFCLNNPLRYVDKNGKYEKDVHVDLTAVLAYAAGFTRAQGNKIGEANQWVDDNPETNPETMSNVKARALYHFTTEARRGELWSEFNSYVRKGTNGDAFSALGTFMHAHQDSYSHEGFNPVTGQVSSGLRRGIMTSWDNFWAEVRKVDKTAFDPEKAERMAETSFTNLLNGRWKMSLKPEKFGSFSPNISYDVIRSSVAAWIRATSPDKKKYYLKEIYKKIDDERKRLQEEESKKKKRRN